MKPGMIRIVSDGTSQGTKVYDHKGEQINNVMCIDLCADAKADHVMARLTTCLTNVDCVARWEDTEELAKVLHEAGREAVEAGATVAAEKFGEQTRTFIEWDYLPESVKTGRRIQAEYLLKKFYITLR
ncbi:MAG: hypothetical protein AB7I29_07665 [Geobacter sp.]